MSKEITWQNRIESFKEQLGRLLIGKKFRWKDVDSSFWKNIPEKPGVYVIIEKYRYIYVGQSKNLRNRLKMHSRANISGDTIHNKLYKIRHISSKEDRKKFVEDKCSFKFLEVREYEDLNNFEHFTIAALNPELND